MRAARPGATILCRSWGGGTGHRGAQSAHEGPPPDGWRWRLVRCRLSMLTERFACRALARQETPWAEVVRGGLGPAAPLTAVSRSRQVREGSMRLSGGTGPGGLALYPSPWGVTAVAGQAREALRRGGVRKKSVAPSGAEISRSSQDPPQPPHMGGLPRGLP
jgi:hypothetical protein